MKHKLIELKEIGNSTIIVGDFNILLSIMDIKPNRRSKENWKFEQYKPNRSNVATEHSTQQEQNIYSSPGHLNITDHMVGNKTDLNKF